MMQSSSSKLGTSVAKLQTSGFELHHPNPELETSIVK
jgi:hypothetical protein